MFKKVIIKVYFQRNFKDTKNDSLRSLDSIKPTYRQINENAKKCWRNERNDKRIDGIS